MPTSSHYQYFLSSIPDTGLHYASTFCLQRPGYYCGQVYVRFDLLRACVQHWNSTRRYLPQYIRLGCARDPRLPDVYSGHELEVNWSPMDWLSRLLLRRRGQCRLHPNSVSRFVFFTALHGMQSRYSDGISVCPSVRLSVRLSNACIVTKRKKALFRFLYHTKEHLS